MAYPWTIEGMIKIAITPTMRVDRRAITAALGAALTAEQADVACDEQGIVHFERRHARRSDPSPLKYAITGTLVVRVEQSTLLVQYSVANSPLIHGGLLVALLFSLGWAGRQLTVPALQRFTVIGAVACVAWLLGLMVTYRSVLTSMAPFLERATRRAVSAPA